MANDFLTLADMVESSLDVSPDEASELLQGAPFLRELIMTPSSHGDVHKYPKKTGAPVVGFRAENAGRDFDSSVKALVTHNLKIMDFSFMIDKAVADSHIRGAEWKIMEEGMEHINAAMFATEKQYINGTVDGDAAGFTGFADSTELDGTGDEMVVNAAGTTPATASSVYGVRIARTGVRGVFKAGVDGDMVIDFGETIVQNFIDGSSLNYPVYYTPGCIWLGIQIGGKYDVGRIVNITEDSGKTLTDLLMSQLLEKFPADRPPTHFLMSRRSRGQLQRSRTTYSPTGLPAPLPQEYEGIPIITTDAIINTEALIA